jgi:hypothetical protein
LYNSFATLIEYFKALLQLFKMAEESKQPQECIDDTELFIKTYLSNESEGLQFARYKNTIDFGKICYEDPYLITNILGFIKQTISDHKKTYSNYLHLVKTIVSPELFLRRYPCTCLLCSSFIDDPDLIPERLGFFYMEIEFLRDVRDYIWKSIQPVLSKIGWNPSYHDLCLPATRRHVENALLAVEYHRKQQNNEQQLIPYILFEALSLSKVIDETNDDKIDDVASDGGYPDIFTCDEDTIDRYDTIGSDNENNIDDVASEGGYPDVFSYDKSTIDGYDTIGSDNKSTNDENNIE